MNRKKGFTLIELLAIIVILAIIAVITVPVILNIVDNAKKKAATTSAYGYKDAVNKWYLSQLTQDNNLKLNDTYTITDGILDGTNIDNEEIPVSGEKPSNGYLSYSNDKLTEGCLIIGDYKVTFENDRVTTTEKGECVVPPSPKIEKICANCVFSLEHVNIQNNSIPQDYVTDYKLLNSNYFNGYVIENDTLVKNYVCGKKDQDYFCIEGSYNNNDVYENNKKLLSNNMFSDLNCSFDVEETGYPGERLTSICENSTIRIYIDTIKTISVKEKDIGYCENTMNMYAHCQQW